jgi:hypothetical protein
MPNAPTYPTASVHIPIHTPRPPSLHLHITCMHKPSHSCLLPYTHATTYHAHICTPPITYSHPQVLPTHMHLHTYVYPHPHTRLAYMLLAYLLPTPHYAHTHTPTHLRPVPMHMPEWTACLHASSPAYTHIHIHIHTIPCLNRMIVHMHPHLHLHTPMHTHEPMCE